MTTTYAPERAPAPAPAPSNIGDVLERARNNWGWFVALGLMSILAGGFALAYVGLSTVATVIYLAAALIVGGLFEIVVGLRAKSWGRLALMIGVGLLYVAAGVAMAAEPLMASSVITLMLGVVFLVGGVMRLVLAFDATAGGARGLLVLSGLVTLALGGMVLAMWPGSSLVLLGALMGVDLLTNGAGWLSLGFALKRRA